MLVSAYAKVVLLGAPLVTLTTARAPRHTRLIALMGIFTIGNLLSVMVGSHAWRTAGDDARTEKPGAIKRTAGCREGLA